SGFATIQAELDEALDSGACTKPAKLRYPNPPWLPQAKSVSVSYTASCSFPPSGSAQASFCYLLPFGGYQLPPGNAESVPLLYVPDHPGQIVLGVSSLEKPQTLNILFQMASGGHRNPPTVLWEHLEQSWVPFSEADEPADTTNNLQQTGVISLVIPAPSAAQQTIAPADRRWLRAAIAVGSAMDSPDLFPETTGIYLNPILVDRVADDPGGADPSSPAHAIKKPAAGLPDIGDINQPAGSFGGRAKESYPELRTRQAERLRHKDRAILPWDYERLVLQAFPDIWKVMALPATGMNSGTSCIFRDPGRVLVVVVAGPAEGGKDPTRPLATVETLAQINQFLTARASAFASICVANPNYISIHVEASVSFAPGEVSGADIGKLNSDLVQYLSPWFYDEFRAEKGGDYASEDAIVEFILTRSYVTGLSQIHFSYEGSCEAGWCFYTSATQHKIKQSPSPAKPVNRCD
ncbi:MAG TPA: baseplate J/gp47 family protein, partial [Bryobacteraceae bacterium]|nr:baseplate J/gp47 family protein [Bryobacteraceae bacterium]